MAQQDIYEKTTARIVEKLEEAKANGKVAPWRKNWVSPGKLARNFNSKRLYRGFVNQFFLALRGFDSPYWNTYPGWAEAYYRAWAKENSVKIEDADIKSVRSRKIDDTDNVKAFRAAGGWSIRKQEDDPDKFEQAEYVTFWSKIPNKAYDPDYKGDDDNKKRRYFFFLRAYKVFNLEQTEGVVAIPDYELPEFDNDPVEAAEAVWEGYENRPKLEKGDPAYSPKLDVLYMPELKRFRTAGDYYSALFHESVHSTGHESRLKRKLSTDFGSEKYSKEELIAEMGASMLRVHCGIDAPELEDNTVSYLDNWIKALKDDPKLVLGASTKASAACDHILGVKHDENESQNNAD